MNSRPVAPWMFGVLSFVFFLIGFETLFWARGILLQIAIAMLIFAIATQLMIGAVLSYGLWRLHQRLSRHRGGYGAHLDDDRAA